MPYCTRADVEFWGQFTSSSFIVTMENYNSSIQRLIDHACNEIDNFCRVPFGFFNAGGVAVDNEYHDGLRVPSGTKPLLRPNYLPVLSVTKLEYLESGSWVTKTEGNSDDYIVVEHGIHLVTLPDRTDYKNIRVSYECGYKKTPEIITTVSGRLAGAVGQQIIDANKRDAPTLPGVTLSTPQLNMLTKVSFTKELKELIQDYRIAQMQVYRG